MRLLKPIALVAPLMWIVSTGCSSEEADAAPAAPTPGQEAGADAPDSDAAAPADAASDSVDAEADADADAAAVPDGSADSAEDVGPEPCPDGVTCVTTFPFGDDRDTSVEPAGMLNGYSCSPQTDEGGPEVVYRVTVDQSGFLSAAVREGDGVDVDVHILSSADAAACLDRGNYDAKADVTPGDWYVVVDTFVSGVPQAGAFHVDIGFIVPSRGPCQMQVGTMERVGDTGAPLAMPATGPMVMEAHLVTQEEPSPYPGSPTDELAEHYELSQSRTGLVMHRRQNWAPLEGGSFYGAGIGSPTVFPVVDEGYYVNMYWTSAARPAKGTKMILQQPGSGRAVVVSAGFETGPGDLSNIGGTPEEPHFYLGTQHKSVLTLGIAEDQSLPFGPRECE